MLIVREPVARAYSEYQMKHRRVQGQDGFEKALQAHAGSILRCVAEAGPRNATRGLRACAPSELQALAKFPQFAASVGVQIARKAKAAKQAGGDDRSALYAWLKACFWVADDGTTEPLADLIGGGRGAARRSRSRGPQTHGAARRPHEHGHGLPEIHRQQRASHLIIYVHILASHISTDRGSHGASGTERRAARRNRIAPSAAKHPNPPLRPTLLR